MAAPSQSDSVEVHPLDAVDEDELYRVMMAERTELIKARREAEDSAIKTIVQISSALVVLIAGLLSQKNIYIEDSIKIYLSFATIALIIALLVGLFEHYFSSEAYEAQQKLVEDYYQKKIATFTEPRANFWVRLCQNVAFIAFGSALISLGLFAFFQSEVKSNVRNATTSSSSAATTTTTTSSSSASTTTTSTSTSSAAGAEERRLRVVSQSTGHQVSSAINATTTAQKEVTDNA